MIHESSGMLSYQAISLSQRGQRDRGETTEMPSGTRAMTTLRKLPTLAPKRTDQSAAVQASGPGSAEGGGTR
jgi:hypothetical protein